MFYIQDLFAGGLRVTEKAKEANHAYGQFETFKDADKGINEIFSKRRADKAQIERVQNLKKHAKRYVADMETSSVGSAINEMIEQIERIERRIQNWVSDAPDGKENKLKPLERAQIEKWRGEIEGLTIGLGILLHLQDNQD